MELLNQQIAALRRQIAALEKALDASEKRDKESAGAHRRSWPAAERGAGQEGAGAVAVPLDFFGELRKVLGDRDDIQIVGDRFVFQSEMLFDSGSAEINPEGLAQLDKLATALQELEGKIPPNINWVLRIDGHTDVRPINTAVFRSNWELSSARAISVVKFLIRRAFRPTVSRRRASASTSRWRPARRKRTCAATAVSS